jgi:XTP/dITP diphosphohydrolase
MKLLFATANQHKLHEVKSLLNDNFELICFKDLQDDTSIEESELTLEGNAFLKADYGFKKYGLNTFSDDTGLEIEALHQEPGVFSARYAGENSSFDDNIRKVLEKMNGVSDRKARFRTVIALILKGKTYYFEGIVNGQILEEKKGIDGFGYDPVFMPEGYSQSFAQMPLALKNSISHRGQAIQKLVDFLYFCHS